MRHKILLFGRPRILAYDHPMERHIKPSEVRLLCYLAIRGAARRQNIAFNLWPNEPEDAALGKLRRHLYNLRIAFESKNIGPSIIAAEDSTIHLNAESFWVDTTEFERLVAQPTQCQAAAELYTADLLEGYDDEWAIVERDRLRSLATSNLARLVTSLRSKRDFGSAIRYAERLLVFEPWREDIIRQLITLRYESGDRSGALNEYERFATRLHVDLSIDPMPETRSLMIAIRQNQAVPEDPTRKSSDSISPSKQRSHFAFVGRETELEFLSSRFLRAAAGSGGGIFIAGESGIGKTRLAQEFGAQVERQGGRTLVGSTSAPEAWPFQGLSTALTHALPILGAADAEPMWLSVLAQVVPDIRVRRGGLPALTPLEKDREQLRLFDAIASCFEALAVSRPLVILIEDLHWAGATSLAAIEFLMRRATSRRIVLLGTYRTEEVSSEHPLAAIRRRLLREGTATQLGLPRLDRAAVLSLTEQNVADHRFRSVSADRIYHASEGNPLLAIQTMIGILESDQTEAPPVQEGTDNKDSMDDAIRRTVTDRIARLSTTGKTVASVAAVIGVGFDVETIEESTGWSGREALNALDELIDRRLIREGDASCDYAFTHHLIQSSIYAEVPVDERRRRHHRVAKVLERRSNSGGVDLARAIAFHYERAGENQSASIYALRAARSASVVFAHEEANILASRTIELCDDARIRFEALALRLEGNKHLGNRGGQQADLEQMDQIARRLADTHLVCKALYERTQLSHDLGERDSYRRLTAELQQAATRSGSGFWKAQAARMEGARELTRGNYALAKAKLEGALEWHALSGDARASFECLSLLADSALRSDQIGQLQTYLHRLRLLADEQENRLMSLRVLEMEARIAYKRQNYGIPPVRPRAGSLRLKRLTT